MPVRFADLGTRGSSGTQSWKRGAPFDPTIEVLVGPRLRPFSNNAVLHTRVSASRESL